MKRLLLSLLLVSLSVASGFAAKVTFHARISSDQEVSASASPIWGVATLVLDPANGSFDLVVNLKDVNETLVASHIHLAAAGVNGVVIVGLGGESAYRRSGGKNLHGKFSGVVPAEHLEAMLTNGTYLNFHTSTYPAGAARGQLLANPVELSAELSGDQEVPPNASPATGIASILYHPGTKTISVHVEIQDFANTVTGSHIHVAPAGVAGGVTRGLGPEASYTRVGTSLTGDFLNLPYAAPAVPLLTGGTYVNVHSAAYPGGEIRGQIYGH